MLNTGRKAQVKQEQQKRVGSNFLCEVESDPAQHCRLMSFDLTMADGMHLAYLLAVGNKITTNFSREMKRLQESG
jgi:hypothetical protein